MITCETYTLHEAVNTLLKALCGFVCVPWSSHHIYECDRIVGGEERGVMGVWLGNLSNFDQIYAQKLGLWPPGKFEIYPSDPPWKNPGDALEFDCDEITTNIMLWKFINSFLWKNELKVAIHAIVIQKLAYVYFFRQYNLRLNLVIHWTKNMCKKAGITMQHSFYRLLHKRLCWTWKLHDVIPQNKHRLYVQTFFLPMRMNKNTKLAQYKKAGLKSYKNCTGPVAPRVPNDVFRIFFQ